MLLLLALALLFNVAVAHAGSVAIIGVEAMTRPAGSALEGQAQDYFSRYPDVANSAFGSSAAGAWAHYQCCGQHEGRTWNFALGRDIRILSYCGDPGVDGRTGGYNCIVFPDGARIGGVSWESSLKVGNSDALSALVTSTGMHLLRTYQKGPGRVDKQVTFPEPIDIPPGGYVWVASEGWGDLTAGGYEVQTALFLLGNNVRWMPKVGQ